jgi:hypothetical protein
MLRRDQISIRGEVEHITRCARRYQAHVVSLGPLVFFSTETGDAWVLDREDHLALELARGGDPQEIHLAEDDKSFQIEWTGVYQIEADVFIVAEYRGRIRSILGYPMREIQRATRWG